MNDLSSSDRTCGTAGETVTCSDIPAGTTLVTFTYDSSGVPASVQVGSNPTTAPRYSYVYNGHGDVVALVDASGNSVASYSYDAFGHLTSASENFGGTTTWTNPYRYDGRDGVRSDGETGLYWMSVRAYDPALGRFLSRDPLGRVPLYFSDQPYVYGGNNPLINVDPSGQMASPGSGSQSQYDWYNYPANGFKLSPNVDFQPYTRTWTNLPRAKMRILARQIINEQDVVGGPGRDRTSGKGWPTYGGAAIYYQAGGRLPNDKVTPKPLVSDSTTGEHVEDKAIDWAATEIRGLVHTWGDYANQASISVHLIATLPPCAYRCQPNYRKGVWMRELIAAASGKLPSAYGGNTGIRILLYVWRILPDYGSGIPRGKSQIRIWSAQFDQALPLPRFMGWVE